VNLSSAFDPILPENLVATLPLAALFKGEFSIDWLLELSGESASVILDALEEGERRGWVSRKNAGRYCFTTGDHRLWCRNQLRPETLPSRCRQAVDILMRDPDRSLPKWMALADLLFGMTNTLDGCRLLIAAGEAFRKIYRDADALACYGKALEDLERLDKDSDTDHLFIDTAIQFSKLSSATADIERTIAILHKAMARAEARKAVSGQALVHMHLAKQEWLRASYAAALAQFDKGWAISRHITDDNFQRSARIFRMHFHYWQGRFREAMESYEQYAPEIDKIPTAHFPLLARLTIGSCYAHCGRIAEGIGMLDTIRQHCEKSENLGLASHAVTTIAMIFCDMGRIGEAVGLFTTALDQAVKGQNVFAQVSAQLGLAYSRYLMGQSKAAVKHLKSFSDLSRKAQIGLRNYPMVMEMCWAMVQGRLPRVEGFSLQEEIRKAVGGQNIFMQGVGHRYQALHHRLQGRPLPDVIEGLHKAVAMLEMSGHRLQSAAAQLDLARACSANGDENSARETAGPAVACLREVNDALIPDDFRKLVAKDKDEKSLLQGILALGHDLVTIRDHRQLVTRILSAACRLSGAERGAILVPSQDGTHLDLKVAKNLTAEDVSLEDFSNSRDLIQQTFQKGAGCNVYLDDGTSDHPSRGAIRSCICVPMLLRKEVIGVLYLDNRLFPSAFAATDVEILDYFAAQAALAMENAKAFRLLEERYLIQEEEKRYHEQQVLERLNYENIVGQSPAIRTVFQQIDSVARTDATTLILGETGVGKELVARAVHRNSTRKQGPFIRVNCSALSEHLIASELFGHEKGAFTGALQRHRGRFELADGGTIFLDEIGDIPLSIQVRLLRVLQSREFERVGGQTIIRSDFRLMAATHRDLQAEVRAGRFREDLYYRLNVFPILVPPLRKRPEDIPLLASHFLAMYAKQQNKAFSPLAREEALKLSAYRWPGNVRELENIIERGVILSTAPEFRVPSIANAPKEPSGHTPLLTHAENERNHIIRVLRLAAGKISGPGGAAGMLDLHPNTLRYRIKKLAIRREDWLSWQASREG